jgi:hypothetical protein
VAFGEVLTQVARQAVCRDDDESRMEPLLDLDHGWGDGFLIESSLERVVVVGRDGPILSLADVSHVRRMMIRARARRGLLYVPVWTTIPNPVRLLATLSKIKIIQLAVESQALIA